MTDGIHHRYSEVLETHVQVGIASGRVLDLSFTDAPEGAEAEDGDVAVLDDLFAYLAGETPPLERHETALTVGGLDRRALERVEDLAYGHTATYDEVARSIGADEDEHGAVRGAIDTNPVPILIPTHRVVGEDRLGGFAGPRRIKRLLLEIEGVEP